MAYLDFEYPRQYPSKVMYILPWDPYFLSRWWQGLLFSHSSWNTAPSKTGHSLHVSPGNWDEKHFTSHALPETLPQECAIPWGALWMQKIEAAEIEAAAQNRCQWELYPDIRDKQYTALPVDYTLLFGKHNRIVFEPFHKNTDYRILVEEKRCVSTFTILVCGYS